MGEKDKSLLLTHNFFLGSTKSGKKSSPLLSTSTTNSLKNWLTFGWFSSGLMRDLPLDVGHFSGWPLLQLKVTGFGADGGAGCHGISADAADFML